MSEVDIRSADLSPEQSHAAGVALSRVRSYLAEHRELSRVRVTVEGGEPEPLELPREALDLLAEVLAHMAAGRGVSVVPRNVELTTQQAADLLNVSRPFLIGLLKAGEIEFRTVGTHRRIKASSLIDYIRRDDQRRRAAADELTQSGQEMGPV
ncbi:helix-turn-helix domain-containing protein [Streptomyces sp. YIM 98790]|uniref:helix-turn-helix domain-containing protein n=1 Tax=Streptomyces sp. YIM 98790 TaxID=2689077 RepID=UPI00140AF3D8|nr:helix-turn-helix domain-containing protein [Streptomyces sp. YIM 98790]